MSYWTQLKEKLKLVKVERLSKRKKSMYENRHTLVRILHDQFLQRMHYLRRKAKNFKFNAFIAMGSIIQPPARRFDKRKNKETFFRRIIDVLFASKLAMRQRIASKQRDADTVMETITNRFAQEWISPRKIKEGRMETTTR